jgi:hypothetical protein
MEKLTRVFGVIVPTFFTIRGGVSISEVARIQAEHKQQNDMFWSDITNAVRGVFRRTMAFVGVGNSTPVTLPVPKVTSEQIGGYRAVANRNAEVSSLMHAVKLYKRLQTELSSMDLTRFVSDSMPEVPKAPDRSKRATVCGTEEFMDLTNIDEMIANMKPEVLAQFDFDFWKEANELNSRAAALGKLLSEQGSFFRELVKPLPAGGDQMTNSGVVVTTWERAYSPEQVAEFERLRDELRAEYDSLQRQLNGRRKQIKDAVRAYNLDQERQYQAAYAIYRVAYEKYVVAMEAIRSDAETFRQEALQETATLRVRTE